MDVGQLCTSEEGAAGRLVANLRKPYSASSAVWKKDEIGWVREF